MNKSVDQMKLEDILDAYVASGDGPNSTLGEWIRRYPEFESELTEFAVSWSLMKWLPPSSDSEAEEVDEETLVLRGVSVVQNLLHRQLQEPASESVTPLESLITEGRARGWEPRRLAQVTRLGNSLLRKLDRRLISHASIPQELINHLAQVLQREATSISSYLQLGPTLGATTEHRSEQAPKLMEPEDFFDAVRADPTISREHAEYWFALERSMGAK
ncbi:MAG: hypothetical protein F4Y80_01155 [Caldilineaceae bacterium SB0665_bin_21]|nr:hypothetical protein [Caldilineaceae bacterium SB0665_bin_21]